MGYKDLSSRESVGEGESDNRVRKRKETQGRCRHIGAFNPSLVQKRKGSIVTEGWQDIGEVEGRRRGGRKKERWKEEGKGKWFAGLVTSRLRPARWWETRAEATEVR